MIPHVYVRPARPEDLDTLYQLSLAAGSGFTSLKPDKEYLANKIAYTQNSFAASPGQMAPSLYFFVAVCFETGEIVGTTAIADKIGANENFYSFKVNKLIRTSQSIDKRFDHEALTLSSDYTGSSELCTLLLRKDYRKGYNGQLLSRCRYLFMSEFEERFSDIVIAEMRGYVDDDREPPFWEHFARHFFDIPYHQADHMSGLGEKQFISELLPSTPFYVCTLPQAAQDAIGEVHPDTRAARHMLEKEGFIYRQYVDVFDAGPTLEAHLEHIKSIKNNTRTTVHSLGKVQDQNNQYIITNTDLDFRAAVGHLDILDSGEVVLDNALAEMLAISTGQSIRYIPTGW